MKHEVSIPNRKACTSSVGTFTTNGLNKVAIIKAIRNGTGMPLKEAKNLVETLDGNESFVIDTNGFIPTEKALTLLRLCGLHVERSMSDPLSFLRQAADLALAVDDVALAADILNVVRKHLNV